MKAELKSPGNLTAEDLRTLKAPFPRESLGVKVQSLSKDRTRAMLVLYLQHTDVQDRLEQVDPAWTCEVLSEERSGDTVYVRTRMTLKGTSRENVGEGGDPKAAYSDALKRCAMLFGVGRYLYDSEQVWTAYDESRDRFRGWTIADYDHARDSRAGARPGLKTSSAATSAPRGRAQQQQPEQASAPQAQAEAPAAKKAVPASAAAASSSGTSSSGRSRDQLNRLLMNLYRPYLTRFPETRFVELLHGRYNVGETRLMTLEQMEDLVSFMEERIKSVA